MLDTHHFTLQISSILATHIVMNTHVLEGFIENNVVEVRPRTTKTSMALLVSSMVITGTNIIFM
jgi:hypothetical protein